MAKLNKYIRKVNRKMRRRTTITYSLIMFTMIFMIGTLLFVYLKNGDRYSKTALENRQLLDQSISYKRGDIVDRNGIVLAKSEVAFNVIMDSVELTDELKREKEVEGKKFSEIDNVLTRTLKLLSDNLNIDEKELRKTYDDNKERRYIILKKNVSNNEISPIKDKIKNDKKISRYGIWFESKYKRIYPFNDMACSLIGFVNEIGDPIAGVEMYYNHELVGRDGRDFEYIDKNLGVLRKKVPPTNGKDVVLTIDVGIQKIVTDKVKAYMNSKKPKNMAVLVMNPSNGEILAMASTPLYDLNNPGDYSDIVVPDKVEEKDGKKIKTPRKWEDLDVKEQSELLQKKWQNYIVSHPFEPGSTFKPITLACGLETNKFDINTTFKCDGGEKIFDKYVYCINREGHGTISSAQAIQYSCNDVLMQMADKIGKKDFLDYQNLFNFGKKTGIDLPEEIATKSMLKSIDKILPVDLATNSFGQNFDVNMMQIACANAAIGNNGKYFKPHVCMEIKDENGNILRKNNPHLVKQVVSKKVANDTKMAMRMVIEETNFKNWMTIEGYEHQLFGKSGTAEKLPRSEGKYISSFIEMAPYENPKLLVYVLIDEGDKETATIDASDISTQICKEVLPMLNIPKQN